ncbi:MAG: DDE-type integrase/transposase/recombinase [Brevibacterium sp.]|nr:DDE-type integrase/transposase/recombinase [Brevibacterium sp.]MDN6747370.1 DDE-type integrase/transposase/recombinase [Brevibacterium sp.]
MLRPQIPKKSGKRSPRQVPVLKATGPGQVWSWDITDLYSTWSGVVFKAYKIIDIFSREIKGYRVEERESDHMAVEMFRTAIAAHGGPGVVHADSGPAMTSNALRDYLTGEGVDLSHNRPYVSNDNPFSEASFRTMKYRPTDLRVGQGCPRVRGWLRSLVQP